MGTLYSTNRIHFFIDFSSAEPAPVLGDTDLPYHRSRSTSAKGTTHLLQVCYARNQILMTFDVVLTIGTVFEQRYAVNVYFFGNISYIRI